jgi:hypothetical protein
MEPTEKIQEYENRIKFLEDEVALLKSDIDAADKKIEDLESQNKISKDYVQATQFITRGQAANHLHNLLQDALHNITITVPSIEDIKDLDIYSVKSTVMIKLACDIDVNNETHKEIIKEFQSFENVSFRVYNGKDRWSAIKDGDELFMGVLGKDPDKILCILTKDPWHVRFFNNLVMDSWLRAKKFLH